MTDSKKLGLMKMLLIGLCLHLVFNWVSVPDIATSALSHLPATWVQNTLHLFSRLYSSAIIASRDVGIIKFNNCFNEDPSQTLKVLIAGHKGGSVFSCLLAWEIVNYCGISGGIGKPVNDDWPRADDIPVSHEVDMLVAVSAAGRWEEVLDQPFNIERELECVVLTRNPFTRFLSLYKYARDGGESGFKAHARKLAQIKNITERVEYVWSNFGEGVLSDNHVFLKRGLERGCTQIKVDYIFQGGPSFDAEIKKLLKALGVKDESLPGLTKAIQVHDLSRQTEEQKAANTHVSGRTLEEGEETTVKNNIRTDSSITGVLAKQCKDLNYDCSNLFF